MVVGVPTLHCRRQTRDPLGSCPRAVSASRDIRHVFDRMHAGYVVCLGKKFLIGAGKALVVRSGHAPLRCGHRCHADPERLDRCRGGRHRRLRDVLAWTTATCLPGTGGDCRAGGWSHEGEQPGCLQARHNGSSDSKVDVQPTRIHLRILAYVPRTTADRVWLRSVSERKRCFLERPIDSDPPRRNPRIYPSQHSVVHPGRIRDFWIVCLRCDSCLLGSRKLAAVVGRKRTALDACPRSNVPGGDGCLQSSINFSGRHLHAR